MKMQVMKFCRETHLISFPFVMSPKVLIINDSKWIAIINAVTIPNITFLHTLIPFNISVFYLISSFSYSISSLVITYDVYNS